MDLLQSLNLDDLPEQQTRTLHLIKGNPDFDLKLGFDSCCQCGKKDPTISCTSCKRVKYCSEQCRKKDGSPVTNCDVEEDEEEEEQALGHTSVICALLGCCNDDEVIEGGDAKEISTLDKSRRSAATDRLVSEFESYPATLANVMMEGPCYQEVLENCKTTKSSLTIHVIGASEDSELWQGHPTAESKVWESYADALAEVAENYNLLSINLQFFGPECPKQAVEKTVKIPPVQNNSKSSTAKLVVTTSNQDYTMNSTALPDMVVFFNPGFT
ncbi:MAG: hypothetical protein SGARI_006054, partial [Bacillariaceae sp.]